MEEARFSISIREITFREQELNRLFAKYKRLENNPLDLYGNFMVKIVWAEMLWICERRVYRIQIEGRSSSYCCMKL